MTEEEDPKLFVVVPRDLLESFDEAIRGRYSNRSEAVRDLMRRYVEQCEA